MNYFGNDVCVPPSLSKGTTTYLYGLPRQKASMSLLSRTGNSTIASRKMRIMGVSGSRAQQKASSGLP